MLSTEGRSNSIIESDEREIYSEISKKDIDFVVQDSVSGQKIYENIIRRLNKDRYEKKWTEGEPNLADEEVEISRQAAGITLSRLRYMNPKGEYALETDSPEESDEKFKSFTRELWAPDLVTHWLGEREGKNRNTDLDGKTGLMLFTIAGIDTNAVQYIEPGKKLAGKIMSDTGNENGVISNYGKMKFDGKKYEDLTDEQKAEQAEYEMTAFIDHHGKDSGPDTSAAKNLYKMLVLLGLMKRSEGMDRFIDFVTEIDNKTYNLSAEDFKNSDKNLYGLAELVPKGKVFSLLSFFHQGVDPKGTLSEDQLKELGIIRPQTVKNGEVGPDGKPATEIVNYSLKRRENIDKSLKILESIQDPADGYVFELPNFGKVLVDVDRKMGSLGADTVYSNGYDTYISWTPEKKSFTVSCKHGIPKDFSLPQGFNMRTRMWFKPLNDTTELTISLQDILNTMAGQKFEATGKLKEYVEGRKIEEEAVIIVEDEVVEDDSDQDLNVDEIPEEVVAENVVFPLLTGKPEESVDIVDAEAEKAKIAEQEQKSALYWETFEKRGVTAEKIDELKNRYIEFLASYAVAGRINIGTRGASPTEADLQRCAVFSVLAREAGFKVGDFALDESSKVLSAEISDEDAERLEESKKRIEAERSQREGKKNKKEEKETATERTKYGEQDELDIDSINGEEIFADGVEWVQGNKKSIWVINKKQDDSGEVKGHYYNFKEDEKYVVSKVGEKENRARVIVYDKEGNKKSVLNVFALAIPYAMKPKNLDEWGDRKRKSYTYWLGEKIKQSEESNESVEFKYNISEREVAGVTFIHNDREYYVEVGSKWRSGDNTKTVQSIKFYDGQKITIKFAEDDNIVGPVSREEIGKIFSELTLLDEADDLASGYATGELINDGGVAVGVNPDVVDPTRLAGSESMPDPVDVIYPLGADTLKRSVEIDELFLNELRNPLVPIEQIARALNISGVSANSSEEMESLLAEYLANVESYGTLQEDAMLDLAKQTQEVLLNSGIQVILPENPDNALRMASGLGVLLDRMAEKRKGGATEEKNLEPVELTDSEKLELGDLSKDGLEEFLALVTVGELVGVRMDNLGKVKPVLEKMIEALASYINDGNEEKIAQVATGAENNSENPVLFGSIDNRHEALFLQEKIKILLEKINNAEIPDSSVAENEKNESIPADFPVRAGQKLIFHEENGAVSDNWEVEEVLPSSKEDGKYDVLFKDEKTTLDSQTLDGWKKFFEYMENELRVTIE